MTNRTLMLAAMLLLPSCTMTENKNAIQMNQIIAQRPNPVQSSAAVPSSGGLIECTAEPNLHSIRGPQLDVVYQNRISEAVYLYWIGPTGERSLYSALEPGQTMARPGSATSFWLVSNAAKECIGIVNPGYDTRLIRIQASGASSPSKPGLVAPHLVQTIVPAGAVRKIDQFITVNEDCTPEQGGMARIAAQPAHGKVTIKKGFGYPSYPTGNPRSSCNKTQVSDDEIWYEPANGYIRSDSVSISYITPRGSELYKDYLVTVK